MRAINQYRTAQDIVAEGLRRGILSGALESGQPLRQEQIAKDFEVSAVPVREALRQLAGEGLVTLTPNRGARVSEVSYEEAREITEIRIALESLALRLSVPNITEDDLRQAEEVLDLWDAAEDPATFAALNWRFHTVLYEPARQPRRLRAGRAARRRTRPSTASHVHDQVAARLLRPVRRKILSGVDEFEGPGPTAAQAHR